jgi:hypothetical protein
MDKAKDATAINKDQVGRLFLAAIFFAIIVAARDSRPTKMKKMSIDKEYRLKYNLNDYLIV